MELPTINLTIPEHILATHRKIPKLIHHSALILPSFSFIWNLVLSLAVIWLLYQHTISLPWIVTLSSLFLPSNAETDLHSAVEQLGTVLLIAVVINVERIIVQLCADIRDQLYWRHQDLISLNNKCQTTTVQILPEVFQIFRQQELCLCKHFRPLSTMVTRRS